MGGQGDLIKMWCNLHKRVSCYISVVNQPGGTLHAHGGFPGLSCWYIGMWAEGGTLLKLFPRCHSSWIFMLK